MGSHLINTSDINCDRLSEHIEIETTSTSNPSASYHRRHDLDALRAVAMLLGIVLHAALSFAPIPWPVQDSQQSEFFKVLFACIHGFRMPLFFMLSGFFTAMLWRKRGLKSLVKHRFQRIFVPLVISCLTIVPAMWAVSIFVRQPSATNQQSPEIWDAVVSGDTDLVRHAVEASEIDVGAISADGASLLTVSVFLGHTDMVKMLLNAGADVNQRNGDQGTALHSAAFVGRAEEAALLIRAGADVDAVDQNGQTPGDLLNVDFQTTNFIATSFGLPLDEEALLAGRKEIGGQLGESDFLGSDANADLSSGLKGLEGLLFQLPIFMHLWFLWFLCWLVVAFLLYTFVANALKVEKLPRCLICSPLALLWLIPLTMLPQSFMQPGSFGPDPSIGLLPIPRVLAYYAIFFFFGAVYWDMDDHEGQLGRRWFASLPIAIAIVFPVALDFVDGTFGLIPRLGTESANRLAANFLQATFAWLMIFSSIGLCRSLLSRESKTLRYISDSSYWLYLVHLPLVILAQWLVRDLQIPALLKFTGITVVIFVFLLMSYEFGVRNTAIGRMLNGPRTRSTQSATTRLRRKLSLSRS